MSDQTVQTAIDKRKKLFEDPTTSAFRLFHGHGDGDPRWDAEWFGGVIVLYVYVDMGNDLPKVLKTLKESTQPVSIWVKDRWRKDQSEESTKGWLADGEPVPDKLQVLERGIHFVVEPKRGFNSGLFLDARPAREKIRTLGANHTIVNLFSYTGSLGVAGCMGGASEVLHVDSQSALLHRIRDNHLLNDLPYDDRMFLCSDAYRFLKKARKGGRKWSMIILDPPPQVAPKGQRRNNRGQDFKTLIPLALPSLEQGGLLITFLNRRDISTEEHLNTVQVAGKGNSLSLAWSLESGEDFPEDGKGKKLRVLAFQKHLPSEGSEHH